MCIDVYPATRLLIIHGQMPREIVHQILDNLTVFQVLQLASCLEDPTYLDHCILGHCKYQHLFKSQKEITEVRDLFIVFHDLRASMKLEQAPVSIYCSVSWYGAVQHTFMLSEGKGICDYTASFTSLAPACLSTKFIPYTGSFYLLQG